MSKPSDTEPRIPMLTLGEMRRVNAIIPEAFADKPDEVSLAFPLSVARTMVRNTLVLWEIEDNEAEVFLSSVTNAELSNVLVIHQLLVVTFRNDPLSNYMLAKNKHFDNRTIWQVIREGESLDVRRYLEHFVFSGGW